MHYAFCSVAGCGYAHDGTGSVKRACGWICVYFHFLCVLTRESYNNNNGIVRLPGVMAARNCIFVGIIEAKFYLRAAVSVVQVLTSTGREYSTNRDNLSAVLLCGQVCSNLVGAGIFVLCNEHFDVVFADM